jgi:hypothetical protein
MVNDPSEAPLQESLCIGIAGAAYEGGVGAKEVIFNSDLESIVRVAVAEQPAASVTVILYKPAAKLVKLAALLEFLVNVLVSTPEVSSYLKGAKPPEIAVNGMLILASEELKQLT